MFDSDRKIPLLHLSLKDILNCNWKTKTYTTLISDHLQRCLMCTNTGTIIFAYKTLSVVVLSPGLYMVLRYRFQLFSLKAPHLARFSLVPQANKLKIVATGLWPHILNQVLDTRVCWNMVIFCCKYTHRKPYQYHRAYVRCISYYKPIIVA